MTLLAALSFTVIGLTGAVLFLGSQYTVIKLTLNWFNLACAFAGALMLSLMVGVGEEYRYNSLLAETQASPSEMEELRIANRALNAENNRLTRELRPRTEILDTSWFTAILAESADDDQLTVLNCGFPQLLGLHPAAFTLDDPANEVCYAFGSPVIMTAFGQTCHICNSAARCR